MAKKSGRSIHLTRRALQDLAKIESWSVEQFGSRTANAYLGHVESALSRVQENPKLLRSIETFHDSLKFYRVEKHLFVCETAIKDRIIVLTVVHGSMDIPERLAELEPTLRLEMKVLLSKLRSAK